jgi:hypothetical protein
MIIYFGIKILIYSYNEITTLRRNNTFDIKLSATFLVVYGLYWIYSSIELDNAFIKLSSMPFKILYSLSYSDYMKYIFMFYITIIPTPLYITAYTYYYNHNIYIYNVGKLYKQFIGLHTFALKTILIFIREHVYNMMTQKTLLEEINELKTKYSPRNNKLKIEIPDRFAGGLDTAADLSIERHTDLMGRPTDPVVRKGVTIKSPGHKKEMPGHQKEFIKGVATPRKGKLKRTTSGFSLADEIKEERKKQEKQKNNLKELEKRRKILGLGKETFYHRLNDAFREKILKANAKQLATMARNTAKDPEYKNELLKNGVVFDDYENIIPVHKPDSVMNSINR